MSFQFCCFWGILDTGDHSAQERLRSNTERDLTSPATRERVWESILRGQFQATTSNGPASSRFFPVGKRDPGLKAATGAAAAPLAASRKSKRSGRFRTRSRRFQNRLMPAHLKTSFIPPFCAFRCPPPHLSRIEFRRKPRRNSMGTRQIRSVFLEIDNRKRPRGTNSSGPLSVAFFGTMWPFSVGQHHQL